MEKSTILQVGVKVFLKREDGRYVVLRRSPLRYPDVSNFWDIPGGRIIPGSTLLDNIKREVYEETKLTVFGDPKLIGAQDITRPGKHIVRLTFSAATEGEPVLDEEHLEFQWVTLEEMKNIPELDEFTREILLKHYPEIL